MVLPKLHFITQPLPHISNAELVEEVCKAGIRLIQLRIKEGTEEFIFEEAKAVQSVCKKYGATFILNDYVSIAKTLNIDGVHLGKNDVSPIKARKTLGNNTIIGGTANTIEDIQLLINAKVNYIGLGPYKHTDTKKNLSPLLGLNGYHNSINHFDKQLLPPIYAIGGIQTDDIPLIMQTGVYGIAISGLIANSNHISKTVSSIIDF